MTPPDTAQPLLLDVPESVHPHRELFLAWLEQHQVTVIEHHPMEDCGGPGDCFECDEPWLATGRRRAPLTNGGGATMPMTARGTSDEEACSKLSRWFGIPHWLEGRAL